MSTLLAMLALAFVAVSPTTAQSEIWDGSGSGAHVWTFAGSNPIGRTDPLGLYGWDDDIDDLIADRTGHALYTIGTLNEGARWASIGLSTALDIAGSLLPGSGLYQAFQSVQVLASGGGGFWEALDIATAAFPVVQKGAQAIGGLKSLFKAKRWSWRACNSFVIGTPVTTPTGNVCIEALACGDTVLTRAQDRCFDGAHSTKITGVFCGETPVVLWFVLETGHVLGMTPGHEVWCERLGWTLASLVQIGDRFSITEHGTSKVIAVLVDHHFTETRDIEVDETNTYFVDGVWVHNGECRIRNSHLAGEIHPRTGVPFDADGFPDFSRWAIRDIKIAPTGHPGTDIAAANRVFQAPPGYSWHHHQEPGRMQLVPTNLHEGTGHTGGAYLWGGGW